MAEKDHSLIKGIYKCTTKLLIPIEEFVTKAIDTERMVYIRFDVGQRQLLREFLRYK